MTTTRTIIGATALFLSLDPDPAAQDELCMAFALCDRPAVGWISHPALGDLAYCGRCAVKLEEILHYRCDRCRSLVDALDAVSRYACGERVDGGIECADCSTDHVATCTGCATAEREADDRK